MPLLRKALAEKEIDDSPNQPLGALDEVGRPPGGVLGAQRLEESGDLRQRPPFLVRVRGRVAGRRGSAKGLDEEEGCMVDSAAGRERSARKASCRIDCGDPFTADPGEGRTSRRGSAPPR
jgi:hypothetical protein